MSILSIYASLILFPSPHLHSVSSILSTFRSKKLFQAYFAFLHLYHLPADLFKQFVIGMKHSSQSCRCYFVEGTTSCFSSLVIFHSTYNFSTREALTALIRKRMLEEVAMWLLLISTNFPFILWTFLHLVAFLAALSAISFSFTSICAGIYRSSTSICCSCSLFIASTINWRISCMDCKWRADTASITLRLSAKIVTFWVSWRLGDEVLLSAIATPWSLLK